MIRYIYLTLFVLVVEQLSAQTMMWSMEPRQYSSITLIAKDVYKVERNGQMGLITPDGHELLPMTNGEIGGFYNGYALVTTEENSRHAINGLLTTDYKFIPFNEKYYTIEDMEFFSDGMIPVTNSRGKAGYINLSGEPVLGFNGKYKMVTPFSEGYASVSTNGKSFNLLIDKHGVSCNVDLGFQVIGGFFNVYNEYAIVYDMEETFYKYNVRTGQVTKISSPGSYDIDYLCCLKSQTNRDERVHFTKKSYKPVQSPATSQDAQGLYGFTTEYGKVILPPQFIYASNILDNHAVVKTSKGYGILKYIPGSSDFAISASKTHHVYTNEKNVTCNFRLNIPSEWQKLPLDIKISRNGSPVTATVMTDGSYSINQNPNGIKSVEFDVAIACEGLMLWNGSQSYTFEKKIIVEDLKVSLHLINDKADKNDHCNVSATITNPGDEAVHCHYSMTGSSTFVSSSGSLMIPAHSSKVVTGYFVIKKAAPKQWVKINVIPGGSDLKSGLELIPFYTGF